MARLSSCHNIIAIYSYALERRTVHQSIDHTPPGTSTTPQTWSGTQVLRATSHYVVPVRQYLLTRKTLSDQPLPEHGPAMLPCDWYCGRYGSLRKQLLPEPDLLRDM